MSDGERAYALKETAGRDAARRVRDARRLGTESLLVVEAAKPVTGRESPDGLPLEAVLVTRYLGYARPVDEVALDAAPDIRRERAVEPH